MNPHTMPLGLKLSNTSHHLVTYAVNRLAAYTVNPSMEHTMALKCLLRYLAGTKTYGITYRKYPTIK
jgi:hypothetical protein